MWYSHCICGTWCGLQHPQCYCWTKHGSFTYQWLYYNKRKWYHSSSWRTSHKKNCLLTGGDTSPFCTHPLQQLFASMPLITPKSHSGWLSIHAVLLSNSIPPLPSKPKNTVSIPVPVQYSHCIIYTCTFLYIIYQYSYKCISHAFSTTPKF